MLNDPVETVVDNSASIRKPMVFFYLVIKGAACGAKAGMIHYRGGPTPGRGQSTGVKIIADSGKTYIQAEVGMHIHPAGDNDLSGSINDFHVPRARTSRARTPCGKILPYPLYLFTGTENIADLLRFFGYDKAIFNKEIFHCFSLPALLYYDSNRKNSSSK